MSLPKDHYRHIPSVGTLIAAAPTRDVLAHCPRWAVLQETRALVQAMRDGEEPIVTKDEDKDAWHQRLAVQIASRAQETANYSLSRVINATGVVLHTNMGRALLAPAAIEHMANVAANYSNLELDLQTGERGSRYEHVRQLVCDLTGAQDAIVVNNNAAAVVLCLSVFAKDRDVILARGELVEIGGSFRIPEIMELSGCRLREIGTTNRVHLRDYETAVSEDTALLLKVHTSNYRVIGFTKTVSAADLRPLADESGVPIMYDLGAGCLVDLGAFGLPAEPTVQESLASGADIVTFSGDKLLGGPQVGVVAGRADLIDKLKKHQLLRAFRVDKLCLAALEATLRIYRDTQAPSTEIPCLQMLGLSSESIAERAKKFSESLRGVLPGDWQMQLRSGQSQVGAGSSPENGLPTTLVAIATGSSQAATVETALRRHRPAVMLRVGGGELLIDLRTVDPKDEDALTAALGAVANQ
ncbi:MAG: L-seryl-tRNA(Sec) selenium transferase [Myxococcales bacterium]|nr:L-seryl-tRNA(Sec) selenium transferase [Myxococcales bacterium]